MVAHGLVPVSNVSQILCVNLFGKWDSGGVLGKGAAVEAPCPTSAVEKPVQD